jgi:DNA-directed RNA polymerase subunit beta
VDATQITVGTTVHKLKKYVGLNERTCNNQKPIIALGDKVEAGQVIADGAATRKGELALGRNVLVGFMSYEGYNFEDAIIISEELVVNDVYTSIHIEEYDVEIRETKLGREEFTRDIPNVSEKMLRNLDDNGIVQVGTYVKPGDVLVGKVSPKSKTELTPEEKLLHAIFGRAGEDVKNDSLEVPSGVEGIVIDTEKFSRRMSLSDAERKIFEKDLKEAETVGNAQVAEAFLTMIAEIESVLGRKLSDEDGTPYRTNDDIKYLANVAEQFRLDSITGSMRSDDAVSKVTKIYKTHLGALEATLDIRDRELNTMKRGDELRSGVLQMVKVYIATKRTISVGDKMPGVMVTKGLLQRSCPWKTCHFWRMGLQSRLCSIHLGYLPV